MKIIRYFIIVLLVAVLLSGIGFEETHAKTWTKSSVKLEMKKTKNTVKKYRKLYEKDKKRVKKENKGKIYLYSSYSRYSYGIYLKGYLVVKDLETGITYAIKSGEDKLEIVNRGDGTYYVEGYIKKIGTLQQKGNVTLWYAKGVNYAKNKYSKRYKNAKKKLNSLQDALEFEYSIEDIINQKYIIGKTYSLKKYIYGSDDYNKPVWITFDDENGTLTSDGKLLIKKAGNINISLKASVSELVSTQTITSEDNVTVSANPLTGSAKIEKENGVIKIKSCEYGDKIQLNAESASGSKFSFTSSNPELFSVDDNGIVTILSGNFGRNDECYVTATDGTFTCMFYIVAQPISYKVSAEYYPATKENDFEIHTWYSDYEYHAKKVYSGDKIQLILDPAPSEGIKYTFYTYDSDITVDENGLVTMPEDDWCSNNGSNVTRVVYIKTDSKDKNDFSCKITFRFYGNPDKKLGN